MGGPLLRGGIMKANTAILLGLCAAVAGCDGASNHDPMAPEDPAAESLRLQSASLAALSNTWAAKHLLPSPRFHHKAATLNNVMYVVGGNGSCCTLLGRVDAY